MRIVEGDSVTIIYPFGPGDSGETNCQIIVYPDGSIKFIWLGAPVMDRAKTRLLISGLEKAVGIAGLESQITYEQKTGPEWIEPGKAES